MTKRNPLLELGRHGVSVWYDNISRALLDTGALQAMIERDGVRGVTSNPTIFEKAIGQSHDYDEAIRRLAKEGRSSQEIFERLALEDIGAAADLFLPLYKETKGRDGFVSLEVAPSLAHDAEGTHREALRLHKLLGRPNVMIKIPATPEGVKAVEETIADGVPVNVTLLFSQKRYSEVVEAYLRGLERRVAAKKDVSRVASVASFFVSRVDTILDAKLPAPLQGKAAVANAKLAYQLFKTEFSGERWKALEKAGARVQRLLWASTSTKNPKYRDVIYVEELVGADVVNTIPPATLDAFRDHGVCRPSLEEDVKEAREEWFAIYEKADVEAALLQLEREGVASFAKSFETLLGQIAAKREMIQAETGVVDEGLAELQKAMFVQRLWKKDPSLWKEDEAHKKLIKNSLGWLTVPEAMAAGLGQIRAFVEEIKAERFEAAVVLGMGGSSLACEVFRSCFETAPGHPRLEVLDTTNPGAVAALERRLDLGRALFIVSSKSGSTVEPNCFMDYFFSAVSKKAGDKAGRQFVAITDPGTSLEKLARERRFRKVFSNPADIGGRYSALSFFGLVPAALMGVDVARLLERARAAARDCQPATPSDKNPALRLGAAMGRHASSGQDKLTLSLPRALESLGLWIEQLIAESTGKEGRGIVPVTGEPLEGPERYGRDRFFVRFELLGRADAKAQEALAALEKAGRPGLCLTLKDVYDLGAQFFIWEAATAAAGRLLGLDPFDQPNVQSAKDQTKKLLGALEDGRLPSEKAALRAGGAAAFCDAALERALKAGQAERSPQVPLAAALDAHFARLKTGDYAAILAFVEPTEQAQSLLERMRAALRRKTTAPVCVELGPRYLHSTGQLHKGGADNGVFLMLVDPEGPELEVPGAGFSFSTLHRAQARGDFAALLAAGRRVLRLDLGKAGENPLAAIANALETQASDKHARA